MPDRLPREPVECDLGHKFMEINLHFRDDRKGGGIWKCSSSEKSVTRETIGSLGETLQAFYVLVMYYAEFTDFVAITLGCNHYYN